MAAVCDAIDSDSMKPRLLSCAIASLRGLLFLTSVVFFVSAKAMAIDPWHGNPWFWSHDSNPIMLIGGSDDDNLFQWPEDRLLDHLNRMQSVGANLVRNTMSDRRDQGFEIYPFLRLDSGQYDLGQWNPEYWSRFARFLRETHSRKIFVQLEIWDRFDFTDQRASDPDRWQTHPYNPVNNINYTQAQTGLASHYPLHPGKNVQPFFFSTPKQRNLTELLRVQQNFVAKLLDFSLQYDHVLYCIDNETSGEEAWSTYWAEFIQQRANSENKNVCITEMWDDWDLTSHQHNRTFAHPDRFRFVDISQNNHNSGTLHWDRLAAVREQIAHRPRPMNSIKIYGATGNKFGHRDQDAIERFWRNLLGGVAAVRFHRPNSGIGLNATAMNCIRAARQVEARVPFWCLQPHPNLVAGASPNHVYVAATKNQSTIVLYFPARAQEQEPALPRALSSPWNNQAWRVSWIDIDQGKSIVINQSIDPSAIQPAANGNCVAILRRNDAPLLAGEYFEIAGKRCFLMNPSTASANEKQPWVMYAPTLLPDYPDEHERWLHSQILNAGVAIAGIDIGEAYGSPDCVKAMNELYDHLTRKRGFADRVALLGRSRGGLWVTAWANANADKVAAIAGIYPVFDLESYPGVAKAASAYGLPADELQQNLNELNPIQQASRIVLANIPMHLIHGVEDRVVPFSKNSDAMRELFFEAAKPDRITVETIPDQGHNYWSGFFTSQAMAQFLIEHAKAP